jgi:hypothetical protein
MTRLADDLRAARIRTGDAVHHIPSDEHWIVAWADHANGYMAPCGWPTCEAHISDCVLERAATDQECTDLIARLSASGRTDAHRARAIASAEAQGGE